VYTRGFSVVTKGKESSGFSKEYWLENYAVLDEMDGVANAKLHARYLKSYLELEMVQINSVIDFGFGLGYMLNEMMKAFRPYRSFGIEPSLHAFEIAKSYQLKKSPGRKVTLANSGLTNWAKKVNSKSKHFDLGICTSVFQYLTKSEIEEVLPVMAKQVRYLYFSVPTDIEFERQVSDLEFADKYAKKRSREYYLRLLKPHFTFISSRLLESKVHFSQSDTPFTDLLFRFE
jgi:hypothetical protein